MMLFYRPPIALRAIGYVMSALVVLSVQLVIAERAALIFV